MTMQVTVTVNGAEVTREIEPRLLLVHFVRDHPPLLGSMSLDLFAVLFGGATALLPAFASDVLHVGPVGLGLLRAAPAVGAALAGAVLALRPVRTAVGHWLFGLVTTARLTSSSPCSVSRLTAAW